MTRIISTKSARVTLRTMTMMENSEMQLTWLVNTGMVMVRTKMNNSRWTTT